MRRLRSSIATATAAAPPPLLLLLLLRVVPPWVRPVSREAAERRPRTRRRPPRWRACALSWRLRSRCWSSCESRRCGRCSTLGCSNAGAIHAKFKRSVASLLRGPRAGQTWRPPVLLMLMMPAVNPLHTVRAQPAARGGGGGRGGADAGGRGELLDRLKFIRVI